MHQVVEQKTLELPHCGRLGGWWVLIRRGVLVGGGTDAATTGGRGAVDGTELGLDKGSQVAGSGAGLDPALDVLTAAVAVLEHLALQEEHLVAQGVEHGAHGPVLLLQLASPSLKVLRPFLLLLPALGGGDAVALEEFVPPNLLGAGSRSPFLRVGRSAVLP